MLEASFPHRLCLSSYFANKQLLSEETFLPRVLVAKSKQASKTNFSRFNKIKRPARWAKTVPGVAVVKLMAASLTLTFQVKQGGFFPAYRGDEHDL